MAEQKSFLTFPISSIRRSIKDIDDSYRNPWDIYAELTQNAVDAIHKMQKCSDEKGKIDIKINAREHSIEISDNGCGISSQNLPELLQLFSSGKSDDPDSVGEKGVGLKFAIFQSIYFKIASSNGVSGGWAEIKDARLWKNLTSNEELKLVFEEDNNLPRGTKIILKGVEIGNSKDEDQHTSIFNLTFDQLKFVLRNATYLGDTLPIWDAKKKSISINLTYSDFNGKDYHEKLDNKFILPIEGVKPQDIVDIDVFESWMKSGDHSDSEKSAKLQNKILILKGCWEHKNYRKIRFWACFLPSRRNWDGINKNHNLLPSDGNVSEEWIQNNSYCMFTPGIYTATKGMPTGISVDSPNTGNAGYWQNYFMIFQDDSLSFDIGRKSIHGRTQSIYQTKAKEIFNKITKYVVKYTSAGGAPDFSSQKSFDRIEVHDEISKKIDLNSSKVVFKKVPFDQEASVAAVFYELIGNETIKDIEPIYSGYKNKYDLYANYITHDGKRKFYIIEFKSCLSNIAKDFPDARKVFDEMDCVVCWNVTDSDVQTLNDLGINCEEFTQSELNPLDIPSSVSHRLTIPNCAPLYVIDLKNLV